MFSPTGYHWATSRLADTLVLSGSGSRTLSAAKPAIFVRCSRTYGGLINGSFKVPSAYNRRTCQAFERARTRVAQSDDGSETVALHMAVVQNYEIRPGITSAAKCQASAPPGFLCRAETHFAVWAQWPTFTLFLRYTYTGASCAANRAK